MLINTENTSHVFQDSVSGSHITNECEKIDHLNNNCKFPNIKNEIEIINIIQQNLKSLIDSEKGKSQVIKGNNDTIYQITNSKNEKELIQNDFKNNQNLTIFDLGECETLLKKEYNIGVNDSLIIIKKEKNNVKPSEKDVQYEII